MPTTRFGFQKFENAAEFDAWLCSTRIARTVLTVQQHHTFAPSYAHFTGSNHFELQRGMKAHHVAANGWADIGQHFSIFPDGAILTGRSMESSPACIYGANAGSLCFEHVGNFDKGKDAMTDAQRSSIIEATAAVCRRFNIPVNTVGVLYHHWFNLSSGVRNNGSGGNKSCPGTAFFGGNKVADCEQHFLPLVKKSLGRLEGTGQRTPTTTTPLLKYVCVVTETLAVRTGPGASKALVPGRGAATLGSVLRVYEEKGGWQRISASQGHWVSGTYTQDVRRATVDCDALNVRSGPGSSFPKVGAFTEGQEVFIVTEESGWCKVSMEEKWVKKDYLKAA